MAAAAQSHPLSTYVRRELESLAKRAQVIEANMSAIRRAQSRVAGDVDREDILAALREAPKSGPFRT